MKQKYRKIELTPDDTVSEIADSIPELDILTGGGAGVIPTISMVSRATKPESVASCVTLCPTKSLDEDYLSEQQKLLLHGRAFIIDREQIVGTSSNNPVTYYIASDQVQGLVIPARTLSLKSEDSDIHYRWTDNGTQWTNWITIEERLLHTYSPEEKCRFQEVQIYADLNIATISLRATR